MASFKLFNSHLFLKSWKPRPVLASPIPTPAHLQSKNKQVRVWILIYFSQDHELHWAGSRLSLWYSSSAWHTRTLSNTYWVNECHHKVSGKDGNVREPKWPKLQNNSPKACSCQSPYRSVHTSIISSPIAQLFMEQPPHANRIDGELDGQTKLSVHRFLWRHTMEWRKWDKAGSAGLYFSVWSKKVSLVVTLRQWREGTEGTLHVDSGEKNTPDRGSGKGSGEQVLDELRKAELGSGDARPKSQRSGLVTLIHGGLESHWNVLNRYSCHLLYYIAFHTFIWKSRHSLHIYKTFTTQHNPENVHWSERHDHRNNFCVRCESKEGSYSKKATLTLKSLIWLWLLTEF